MLGVPAYKFERRLYSATSYPTSFTLDSLLPSGFVPSTKLVVGASPRALGLVKDFSCSCMFWDKRGGGLAPMGPQVDTATI